MSTSNTITIRERKPTRKGKVIRYYVGNKILCQGVNLNKRSVPTGLERLEICYCKCRQLIAVSDLLIINLSCLEEMPRFCVASEIKIYFNSKDSEINLMMFKIFTEGLSGRGPLYSARMVSCWVNGQCHQYQNWI